MPTWIFFFFWLRWVFVVARELSLVVVHGLLIAVASLVVEHGLSSCGSRAWLLHSMWDLPRPGLEPVFPELAGGFLTTAPPGKSQLAFFKKIKIVAA